MKAGAYYNEIDPFAAAWLRELIKAGEIAPGEVDERSVVDVQPADLVGFSQCHFFAGIGGWSLALRLAGWPDDREVWTGSCPCQPWSVAGLGKGADDPRHLWPAWFRLIGQSCPPVVFGEQTASEDGRYWLDLVYVDLEARGYAVGAANLPAAGIGAPHARARLWFVANADSEQLRTARPNGARAAAPEAQSETRQRQWIRPDAWEHRSVGALGHSNSVRAERIAGSEGREEPASSSGRQDEGRWGLQTQHSGSTLDMGNAHGKGLALGQVNQDGPGTIRIKGSSVGHADATRGVWAECEWLWHRDGVYRAVEPGTFPLAARLSGDVDKIRAFGNAIVPQVAAEVIGAYMEIAS